MKSFYNDYEKIISSDFFIQYPDEQLEFNNVRDLFRKNTQFLSNYLYTYYWVSIILNILLIAIICNKLEIEINAKMQ